MAMKHNTNVDLDPRLSVGLLYPAYFPFDTKQIEYFIPTWLCQCISTFFCMTGYASFDAFISVIVLHVSGQLTIVGISLKKLVNESIELNSEIFWKNLAHIIEKHERLIG